MKRRTSVAADQPQLTRLDHRVVDGLDASGLDQKCLAVGCGNIFQGHAGDVPLATSQDRDQQFVAQVPRLGAGRLADAVNLFQRLLILAAQGIGQGKVADGVEIVGGQRQAFVERHLGVLGVAAQDLGNAQTVPGFGLIARVGGLGQGGDGTVQLAQAYQRRAQAQQRIGGAWLELKGLLICALRASGVVAGQACFAQLQPGIEMTARLLRGLFVERSGGSGITTFFQIAGQPHETVVAAVGRQLAGTGSEQRADDQQQGGRQAVLHKQDSAGRRGGHFNGLTLNSDRYVREIITLVIVGCTCQGEHCHA